jgi:hypothetical protein
MPIAVMESLVTVSGLSCSQGNNTREHFTLTWEDLHGLVAIIAPAILANQIQNAARRECPNH